MSNMPWFPFYVDDFMASPKVARMTMEEVGVYVFLLCQQHQEGAVEWPCERIANALRGHERNVEYVLSECFQETPEGWKNPRLERINREQIDKSEKASRAAKARWDNASDANASANAKRTQSERNANQNQNQNQKKSGGATSRAHALPKDWEPTTEHGERASAAGIDVEREAAKFRAHAEANNRKQVVWNGAFTQWLIQAEEYAQRDGRGKAQPGTVDADFVRTEIERRKKAIAENEARRSA